MVMATCSTFALAILASRAKIWREVRKEIAAVKKSYGDKRLTAMSATGPQLTYDKEDFVVHEEVFVVLTRNGWLKRLKSYDPRTQLLKEGDEVLAVINANTRETVALFSNFGKVYVSSMEVVFKAFAPVSSVNKHHHLLQKRACALKI